MNLSQVIDRYLEEKQTLNPATVSNCKRILRFFGDIDIGTISEKRMMDYVLSRRSIAKPATINRELTILKQIFRQIHRQGLIPKDPSLFVSYEKMPNIRDRWLTIEEESLLISSACDWLKPIIIFAISTGMRRGEILNLRLEAINFKTRTVTLNNTKNGVNRLVPLTDRALKSIETNRKEGPAFLRDNRGVINTELEYSFKQACIKASLLELHFHDLRHTFATRLVQHGVELYTIQRLLGHKNPSMTQRYAHHSVESQRRALESVPGI